jgi:hypothetical protein
MTIFARSVSGQNRDTETAANQSTCTDIAGAVNDRVSAGAGRFVLNTANSTVETPAAVALSARRGDLKPADRDTFDLWARRVVTFYSLLAIALLGAMLLGAHAPERRDLLASHSTAGNLPELSAPETRSAVK